MAIKKSELYSSIWKSCDELRGGMDASQYKDYVLVLLFVKYVSDKYAGRKDALLEVPDGGGFADMVALKGNPEIGDKINKIIGKLAEPNQLKGIIDVADFNDPDKLGKGKEMVVRLSNLVAIFEKPELDFRGNRADGDDLLGDAYEYLMRHFATESGKSKGQFYTPAEVSRVIAKVIGMGGAKSSRQTIHDPTCGSGSLLLKAHDEAKSSTKHNLTIYGQERDNATRALAKMNMILHECPSAEIWQDNTLSSPYFKEPNGRLKTFDFVVANPPFSDKAWSSGLKPGEDEFKRFELGVPPAKNGDYAFLLHVLTVLKSTGKGAVILPHGVLFRGGAEAEIRKNIINRGYIKGIIGMPANLFYGTSIPACIVVLDKENADTRKGIFMIDASKGFLKDGNKNRLRARDIHLIVDVFTRKLDTPRYARMVPLAEIEGNHFNLNLARYIESTEPEDIQDIDGHLRGGIPVRDIVALEPYWNVFPGVYAALFTPERSGYLRLQVPAADVKTTIFDHSQFTAFNRKVTGLFVKWKTASLPQLSGIAVGDKPKALIETLSEAILEAFEQARLVDAYAVYQHLMDYWAELMQDDVYQIAQEGWTANLVPQTFVVRRYFTAAQKAIDDLEANRDAVSRQVEELDEEHAGEDGLLADARTDKGKLTAKTVKDRVKAIKEDKGAVEELMVLERYIRLIQSETAASERLREAQKELEAKVAAKCDQLTEEEIKTIVVEDKWVASLAIAVQSELDRVSQALTGRICELAERYESPLPKLTEDVATLANRVNGHLKAMGAVWS
jgi:type I restriction enzyme M protein